jgi:hypothetical protein
MLLSIINNSPAASAAAAAAVGDGIGDGRGDKRRRRRRTTATKLQQNKKKKKKQTFKYVVDTCEPAYDEIPCPLYPAPSEVVYGKAGMRAGMRGFDSWERGSAAAAAARATVDDKTDTGSSSGGSSGSTGGVETTGVKKKKKELEKDTKVLQDCRSAMVLHVFEKLERVLLEHYRNDGNLSALSSEDLPSGIKHGKLELPSLKPPPEEVEKGGGSKQASFKKSRMVGLVSEEDTIAGYVAGAKKQGMPGLWSAWVKEFETGGFNNCGNFRASVPAISERLRVAAPKASWCEAALDGPGGIRYAGKMEKKKQPTTTAAAAASDSSRQLSHPHSKQTQEQKPPQQKQKQQQQQAEPTALSQPLGVWCSLPKEGHFVEV